MNDHNYIQSINETKFYQKTSRPLFCTREMAINLSYIPALNLLKKYPQLFASLDATGSLVDVTCCPQNLFHHQSRILNHIMVVRIAELNLTVPVFESISSMSNSKAISKMLSEFLNIMAIQNIPWCFKFIIIDWSKAYMHALSETLNQMTFVEYLNQLYRGKEIESKTKTYILACVSHFTHMISRNINKHIQKQNQKLKAKIMEVFCLLVNCTTIDEVKRLIYLGIVLFESEHEIQLLHDTKTELEDLVDLILSDDKVKNEPMECDDHTEEKLIETDPISKKKISFYNVFLGIKQEADEAVPHHRKGSSKNEHFDEDHVFVKLVDEYIAYIIIWSRILYHKDTSRHVSNAVVENHNKTIKCAWLKGQTKLRPAEYITITHGFIKDQVDAAKEPYMLAK